MSRGLFAPEGFRLVPGSERATRTSVLAEVTAVGTPRDPKRLLCKRLSPRARGEGWMRELLTGEGRVLAILGGEGAPALVAAGEDALGPFLVMELVDAPALASFVGAREAWFAAGATLATFEALAAAHARGVVHGDLSPENVLVALGADRVVESATLVDFGLALWPGAPRPPQGPFRGTLLYVAPEIARSERADARADVFAAAASLLHAHSGEAPRSEGAEAAALVSAGEQPVESWASRASEGLPGGTRDVLIACCAFDPASRPRAAQDVVAALRRL